MNNYLNREERRKRFKKMKRKLKQSLRWSEFNEEFITQKPYRKLI